MTEIVRRKLLEQEIYCPDQLETFTSEKLDSAALADDFPAVQETVTPEKTEQVSAFKFRLRIASPAARRDAPVGWRLTIDVH